MYSIIHSLRYSCSSVANLSWWGGGVVTVMITVADRQCSGCEWPSSEVMDSCSERLLLEEDSWWTSTWSKALTSPQSVCLWPPTRGLFSLPAFLQIHGSRSFRTNQCRWKLTSDDVANAWIISHSGDTAARVRENRIEFFYISYHQQQFLLF